MKKIYVFAALVLVIVVACVLYRRTPPVLPTFVATGEQAYTNETYGISFSYPRGYVLTESEQGDAHRGHYAIMIVREADALPRENSEGPTAISFDIYQNNLDRQTLRGWLEDSSYSNYKLSNDTYLMTRVGGVEAIAYHWSGLYEATTTAFIHNDNIIAASVTYITPEDAQIGVYNDVLKSVRLLAPVTSSLSQKLAYVNASTDLIKVESPLPGATIGKSFDITGEARGGWFFEASFPIEVVGADDTVLVRTYATAQSDWMTESFVPFRANVVIPGSYVGPAMIILKKDNPSGLAEHDGSVSFRVVIQ
ncbi:MAG: Gmad2 immunoglobulin-like domain-containing protein [Minisyncoccota bacterium]